jgi:LysR family transcriptional regulator, glycine cleavage system transcriptional activator
MRKSHRKHPWLPSLNALRAFEAAARHQSATGAARELGVTQGAISRQIAALEAAFDERLFVRSGGHIHLTPRAGAYAAAMTRFLDDVRDATDTFLDSYETRVVTVRGYLSFLNRWLLPRLPGFARREPSVSVRLLGASGAAHVDFSKDRADVGIRYGRGSWKGLTSHLLLQDDLIVVCAPVAARRARLKNPRDLARLPLLQSRARERDWTDWLRLGDAPDADRQMKIVTMEDLGVALQCALEGDGAAIVQRAYVVDELATGRLVAPFETALRRVAGYHLVYPNDRALSTEAVDFRDWLLTLSSSTNR